MGTPNQAISFPVLVKKEIVFAASCQEDLDYLNSKDPEGDFILDMKDHASSVGVTLISVDDVKI